MLVWGCPSFPRWPGLHVTLLCRCYLAHLSLSGFECLYLSPCDSNKAVGAGESQNQARLGHPHTAD